MFENTKLPLTSWFLAIYHLTQSKGGISSIELGRRLGVKQPTAWLMKHKLMRAMAGREAHKPKLAGRIEIDDTYLGGERSGGKRGRGAAGKTPVVAAVETTAKRKPRRLKLTVVKGFRKKEVATIAKRDFMPGSNVVSDGLSCWLAVEQAGCLPRFPAGSASTTSLSRPAQASLALRPVGSLSRPRRPLSRGFDPPGCPDKPLVSYQINRQLPGWNLPPLVTRAVWAHWEIRAWTPGWRGARHSRSRPGDPDAISSTRKRIISAKRCTARRLRVHDAARQTLGNPEPALDVRQHQHAVSKATCTDLSAIDEELDRTKRPPAASDLSVVPVRAGWNRLHLRGRARPIRERGWTSGLGCAAWGWDGTSRRSATTTSTRRSCPS